jgi:hypothetical protein
MYDVLFTVNMTNNIQWTFEEYVHLVGFMQICTSFLPLCCDSIKNTYNNQTKKNKYYTLD